MLENHVPSRQQPSHSNTTTFCSEALMMGKTRRQLLLRSIALALGLVALSANRSARASMECPDPLCVTTCDNYNQSYCASCQRPTLCAGVGAQSVCTNEPQTSALICEFDS